MPQDDKPETSSEPKGGQDRCTPREWVEPLGKPNNNRTLAEIPVLPPRASSSKKSLLD